MTYPQWPEWGAYKPDPPPWHYWTSPEGAHHAGPVLDTVIAPWPGATGELREYTVMRCDPCVLIHVTPLPSQKALATYYQQFFFQAVHPDMATRYQQDIDWWRMTHDAIISKAVELLGTDIGVEFLEIGVGTGIALDVASDKGLNTWGCEPDPLRAESLRQSGIWAVYDNTFHEYADWSQTHGMRYDIIYMYETLEHMPDPEEVLLRCWDLLRPNGLVVIQVPNDWNCLQIQACQMLGLPHWFLKPPEHLYYYTPKTLQLLLRRCGFTIAYNRSTYPLERFLIDEGKNYIGNDTLGRQCHAERMRYELEAWHTHRWQFVEDEYRANLEQGVGRELVYIARRRD